MNIKTKKLYKDTIVFAPTNGVGLGHLTRTLAIARRLKKLDPSKKIVFFTTCPATYLIEREGFIAYYFPSLEICDKNKKIQWNYSLRQNISKILYQHKPSMFIFDGAYPYMGILTSINSFKKNMKCIWIRKNQYKDISELQKNILRKNEQYFHYIVTPHEIRSYNNIIKNIIKNENNYITNSPIIYLDKSEALDKYTVRKLWKVPDHYKIVYIQLGAGKINDIQTLLNSTLHVLKSFKKIFIVIGESIIGEKLNINYENILVLKDYPNSRFFKAIDLAISAAGYNTYHELIYFEVPTIFVPNEDTNLDSQLTRAINAEKMGAAIVLRNPTQEQIKESIEAALDDKFNTKMRESAKKLIAKNGADELAQLILDLYDH